MFAISYLNAVNGTKYWKRGAGVIHASSAFIKDIVAKCAAPCATLLDFEHECPETCGQCLQGIFQINCKAKGERALV